MNGTFDNNYGSSYVLKKNIIVLGIVVEISIFFVKEIKVYR